METSWITRAAPWLIAGVLVGVILDSKMKLGAQLSKVPVVGGLFA